MSQETLRIQKISGHAGSVPGEGMQREYTVCKLIDTTTCIGCKACEVACMEWNDLPFGETVFDNSYQTMPETRWNYWNLILFNEHEREDGTLMWLMRKNHRCIGCGYCITGCPFNIPKFNKETKRVYKCTLCTDRVNQGLEPACIKSCPTGCLHFGSKDDMKYLAEQRAKQLRDHYNFPSAGVYDPPGVGGTGVIYVLHDAKQPELYGGLPKDPHIPLSVKLWKGPLKWLGNLAMVGGLIGLFVHYLRYGPKDGEAEIKEPHEGAQP
jgi:Fe-S-cluster-containing dehydrogenase component